ncbi:MAG: type II secretion system F family protein [Candidatus Omnitrophota bacterium]
MNIFKTRRLMYFYSQLAAMIESGMDILSSVNILIKHTKHNFFRVILVKIKQHLSKGETLGKTLSFFPDLFTPWQVSVVSYSEKSGKLAEGLNRIVGYFEKRQKIINNIFIALAYPAFISQIAIFLIPLPRLIEKGRIDYLYGVLKAAIPLYLILFIFVVIAKLIKSPGIRRFYDSFVLDVPFFGNLIKRIELTGFIQAQKCLYDSGAPMVENWKISSAVVGNLILKRSLARGVSVIERGGTLNDAFASAGVFEPEIIGMVATGVESGSIGKMLDKIVNYSESKTDLAMGILLKILPVVFFLAAACSVAYGIISFYAGYFSKIFPQ